MSSCLCGLFAAMAHFPRWISSCNVDSGAMLHAYQCFMWRERDELERIGCYGKLPLIHHIGSDYAMSGCRDIACPHEGGACFRCYHRRGGYTFRWYSLSWHDDYIAHSRGKQAAIRKYVWYPGEDENWASIDSFVVHKEGFEGGSFPGFILCQGPRINYLGYELLPRENARVFLAWRRLFCLIFLV